MPTLRHLFVLVLGCASLRAASPDALVFPPAPPAKGKHIVLVSGDEEYRSEEGLPMLAKILSQRHGFKCTVLFALDPDGTINPDNQRSLPGAEALDQADLILMLVRFRQWPDDVMERFERVWHAGLPIVALRTSTHAFQFPAESRWAHYSWKRPAPNPGGWGRLVIGETWGTHWGKHKVEATRGILEPANSGHPLLRGLPDRAIFGPSDVYEVSLPADAMVLVRGEVLAGMSPESPPATHSKPRAADKVVQPVNDPMMPLAWTRVVPNPAGRTNRVFATTMGAATDLENEALRRLVVNGVYWGLSLEIPPRADAAYVDGFVPSAYGFKTYRRGLRPADLALGRALPPPPPLPPAAVGGKK